MTERSSLQSPRGYAESHVLMWKPGLCVQEDTQCAHHRQNGTDEDVYDT